MTRPHLNEIFKRKYRKSKDQAMHEADTPVWLYFLEGIAEYIGTHYTTVSRAIRKTRVI